MHFEHLIGRPALESELMKLLVTEIQSHYADYQQLCFFMKLNKHARTRGNRDTATNVAGKIAAIAGKKAEQLCEITWIKTFKSADELKDFYYDTVMDRACNMVKFRNGRYEILCRGFYYSNRIEVWTDHSSPGRPINFGGDRELQRMTPRELIEQGFGEIAQTLVESKKAM